MQDRFSNPGASTGGTGLRLNPAENREKIMVSVPQIIAFSFSNIRQIIEVFGFIYLFYYFAEEHSIYYYNNSDS